MINIFLFSKDHLILILIFSVFLFICPKLTKNMLPYSYFVEKMLCVLIIFEIIFEQMSLSYYSGYNELTSLPINISRITAYICLLILLGKQYHLFNIFFSWSLVCSIGELILIKNFSYEANTFLFFLYLLSKCLLIYANVYMVEVRKFKINRYAIRDSLSMCLIYFSFVFLLNKLTLSNYPFAFLDNSLSSIFLFIALTTSIYFLYFLFTGEKSYFKFNRKGR